MFSRYFHASTLSFSLISFFILTAWHHDVAAKLCSRVQELREKTKTEDITDQEFYDLLRLSWRDTDKELSSTNLETIDHFMKKPTLSLSDAQMTTLIECYCKLFINSRPEEKQRVDSLIEEYKKLYPEGSQKEERLLLLQFFAGIQSKDYSLAYAPLNKLNDLRAKKTYLCPTLNRYLYWIEKVFTNVGKSDEKAVFFQKWFDQSDPTISTSQRVGLLWILMENYTNSKDYTNALEIAKQWLKMDKDKLSSCKFFTAFHRLKRILPNVDKEEAYSILDDLITTLRQNNKTIKAILVERYQNELKLLKEDAENWDMKFTRNWEDAVSLSQKSGKPILEFNVRDQDEELFNTAVQPTLVVAFSNEFIPVKTIVTEDSPEAPSRLIVKKDDGSILSQAPLSSTTMTLLDTMEKGLKEHIESTLLPNLQTPIEYLSVKGLAHSYFDSGKVQIADALFQYVVDSPKASAHERGGALWSMAGRAESREERIEKFKQAYSILEETSSWCPGCPMGVLVNLAHETKGTTDYDNWVSQIEAYKTAHDGQHSMLERYYPFKIEQLAELGDMDGAIEVLSKVEEDKSFNFWRLIRIYSHLASTYQNRREFDQCFEMMDKALAVAKENGSLTDISWVLFNIGAYKNNVGEKEESRRCYEESAKLAFHNGNYHRAGDSLRELATHEEKDDKLKSLTQSTELLRKSVGYDCMVIALAKLARFHADNDDFAKADTALEKIRKTIDIIGRDRDMSKPYSEAYVELKRKNHINTATIVENTLTNWDKTKPEWMKGKFYSLIALSSFENQDYKQALEDYEKYLTLIEDDRTHLQTLSRKRKFTNSAVENYAKSFECALRTGDKEKAFEIMERSRARAFIDLLWEKIINGQLKSLPPTLARRIAKERILDDEDSAHSTTSGQVEKDETLFRDLNIFIREASPEIASIVNAPIISLRDFQRLLKDETVVEYYLTPGKLYIWTITQDDAEIAEVDIPAQKLKELVEKALGAIIENEDKNPALTELYKDLIAPIDNTIGSRRNITIIPHQILHYAPFHALRSPAGGWFCEDHISTLLPSASALPMLKRNTNKNGLFLGIGSPAVLAKFKLAHSETELNDAASSKQEYKLLTDTDATIEKLKEAAASASTIHFACRSALDIRSPMNSYLLLSDGNEKDGKLTLTDIMRLPLNHGPLIVLGASDTAVGDLTDNDEVTGFARSFLNAGARNVVAAMWRVKDVETADFMSDFHQNLASIPSPAEALNETRLNMIKRHAPISAWAAFSTYGNH